MNAATTSLLPPSPAVKSGYRIVSKHFRSGHIHFLIRDGKTVTCFIERPGISQVLVRPRHLHPAAFVFHKLRFEALRVGGTMIIVRNDSEVLEEVYPDQHIYHLTDGNYFKSSLTDKLRPLLATDAPDTLVDNTLQALNNEFTALS